MAAFPPSLSTLKALTMARDCRTKRQSSWDQTGGNRDAWPVAPGETKVLAEMEGAGCITHIWVTVGAEDNLYLRKTLLRMFWDGEKSPSVETPLGDFFGIGHGITKSFCSLPLTTVGGNGGYGGGMAMNCYFQMPYAKSARVEVENQSDKQIGSFYFYVDYEEWDSMPDDVLRFHAQWRRENPTKGIKGDLEAQGINYWELGSEPNIGGEENYVMLEAQGRGHYVGCTLHIDNFDRLPNGGPTWWGEGDDMIFIDGEKWPPSLHGTGSEDYLCHAWGMHPYAYPYAGCSLHEDERPHRRKLSVYRFHIQDPVVFQKSVKVTIEHGHANTQSNDYASVAYWYQTEPHAAFPAMLPVEQRLPRPDRF
jgi:hypothetical protein